MKNHNKLTGLKQQDDNYFIILDIEKIVFFIDLEIAQMALAKSK